MAGVRLYESRTGSKGSSFSGLHAKTFSVDRSSIFVGSFNFDPRSEKLNIEMEFVINSPTLAQRISHAFLHTIPDNTYQLGLSIAATSTGSSG